MNQQFFILGISDQAPRLSPEALEVLATSKVFSGGRRHYSLVRDLLPADAVWIEISVPLDAVFEQYAQYGTESIVVFASGDPLFYGFGATVLRRLPTARVEVIPYFNSLQMLAHATLTPYEEMHAVSLTGRPWQALDRALIEGHRLVGCLTDHHKTPQTIAKRMLLYGYSNYRMTVGEKLGNPSLQQITNCSLEDAAETTFATPNCLLLTQTTPRVRPFGIPEQLFKGLENRPNMLTKRPVRLLSLSFLDLRNRSVFWDVGFCTGSVSVEAKLQFPQLYVVAFEKRPQGIDLMETNSRRFGALGIEAYEADFFDLDLTAYPAPDAVFIGGHGGRLPEMILRLAAVMLPQATLVFNAVSPESRQAFERGCQEANLSIQESTLLTVDQHNPITVYKAIKA